MKTKVYKWFFSIFSGTVYKVEEDEVKNLDEGQIPLVQPPDPKCNRCYGRGWESRDVQKGIYIFCSTCRKKCGDPNYTPKNIIIPLAKKN